MAFRELGCAEQLPSQPPLLIPRPPRQVPDPHRPHSRAAGVTHHQWLSARPFTLRFHHLHVLSLCCMVYIGTVSSPVVSRRRQQEIAVVQRLIVSAPIGLLVVVPSAGRALESKHVHRLARVHEEEKRPEALSLVN